jgi:hypothetical protein
VPVPGVDDPRYADAVRAHVEAQEYVAVLPASDAAMFALGSPGRHLLDKASLATLAAAAGLKTPPGRTFDDAATLRAAADGLDYPCVVKPVRRTGRRPLTARRFDSPRELRQSAELPGPLLVQPHVADGMHSVAGVMWRGELKVAVHQRHVRIWPPQCGDACYAVTTAPDPALEEGLRALLSDYDGIFQAEFAGPYLLDLNPRVYGSLPLAVAAGANPVGAFCDLLQGADVGRVRARPGVDYHWWEGDLRHVAARWRSGDVGPGEALRALRLTTAVAGADLRRWDPKPSLVRLRHVTGQLAARLSRTALPGRTAHEVSRRPSSSSAEG